jgi:predicted glycoside hydrolase/deacetylase ChbG (UPF0249 family)
MDPQRLLIVNAHDFGQSFGVNRGIIEAHRCGIVTSTSLMVRWPAATEASVLSLKNPDLNIGLHLDLGEWFYSNGKWINKYKVVSSNDRETIYQEVTKQLSIFQDLLNSNPTHIDSHQNVHLREPVRSIALELARKLNVPLIQFHPNIHYCGDFYGQSSKGLPIHEIITVKNLINILTKLPPGITELVCHPAKGKDLDTMYLEERMQELRVLCDPRVRETLASLGIKLCSFRDVRK